MKTLHLLLAFLSLAIHCCSGQAQAGPTLQQQWEHPPFSPLSVASLELQIMHEDVPMGVATGFVLEKGDKHYLVTNRHVVLACAEDQNPQEVGGWICATKIRILHNRKGSLGQWFWVTEDLFDADHKRRWIEHPTLRGGADLVALPLVHSDGIQFYSVDVINLSKTDMLLGPGEAISIAGFPQGLAQIGPAVQTGSGLAVWKTGTLASDMGINVGGKPTFLVDTTSRPGMSGSPVYAVRYNVYRSAISGAVIYKGDGATRFLGVYGQQSTSLEIGVVWKAELVAALYNALP